MANLPPLTPPDPIAPYLTNLVGCVFYVWTNQRRSPVKDKIVPSVGATRMRMHRDWRRAVVYHEHKDAHGRGTQMYSLIMSDFRDPEDALRDLETLGAIAFHRAHRRNTIHHVPLEWWARQGMVRWGTDTDRALRALEPRSFTWYCAKLDELRRRDTATKTNTERTERTESGRGKDADEASDAAAAKTLRSLADVAEIFAEERPAERANEPPIARETPAARDASVQADIAPADVHLAIASVADAAEEKRGVDDANAREEVKAAEVVAATVAEEEDEQTKEEEEEEEEEVVVKDKRRWTPAEDAELIYLRDRRLCSWREVSRLLRRSVFACRVRRARLHREGRDRSEPIATDRTTDRTALDEPNTPTRSGMDIEPEPERDVDANARRGSGPSTFESARVNLAPIRVPRDARVRPWWEAFAQDAEMVRETKRHRPRVVRRETDRGFTPEFVPERRASDGEEKTKPPATPKSPSTSPRSSPISRTATAMMRAALSGLDTTLFERD